MTRIIGATAVSFLAVAGAGLLLAWAYQPATSEHGMVALVGTLAAVLAPVVTGSVWAAKQGSGRDA